MISTPILDSAASLMDEAVLVDTLSIYNVGELVTVGFVTERETTLVQDDVRSLVQTTVLANAIESAVTNNYSVKVGVKTSLVAGQMVEVKTCTMEPGLVGKRLLIDKVSQNGLAILRKAVASDFNMVDQQGKENL